MRPPRVAVTFAVAAIAIAVFALAVTSAPAQVGINQSLLNPNLATEQELAAVPHVGVDGAATIIGGRPWVSVAALDTAIGGGLSDEQRDDVYSRLWLPINLNDVTDAEIQLIPGVGPPYRARVRRVPAVCGAAAVSSRDRQVCRRRRGRTPRAVRLRAARPELGLRGAARNDSGNWSANDPRVRGVPSLRGDRAVSSGDR